MQTESQVQQSVGVAATLIDQYRDLVGQMAAAGARGDSDEQSVNRAHLERVYSSIWEQLDAAAQLTRAAGRALPDYDNLRAQTETREAAVAGTSDELIDVAERGSKTVYTFEHTVHHNDVGLALAMEATASLERAWPELSWSAEAEAEADLRPGGIHKVIRGVARLFGKG